MTRQHNSPERRRGKRERGIIIFLTCICIPFVVPVVGLAIDVSLLYTVSARLSGAVDAAALAAARSLSVGQTLAEQEGNAIDTATRFFHANFPNHFFFTNNKTVEIAVAETATRTRTVTVTGRVTSPNFFLRYLGKDTTNLSVTGRASRRDVNIMLILDRSGSMNGNGGCAALKTAVPTFVNKFANYRDRLGVVFYGGDAQITFQLQDPPGNFLTGTGSIPDLASRLTCTGWTNASQAIWLGYGEIKRINEPGALNVLVFFTDGQPNTVTYTVTPDVLRLPTNGRNFRPLLPQPPHPLSTYPYVSDPATSIDPPSCQNCTMPVTSKNANYYYTKTGRNSFSSPTTTYWTDTPCTNKTTTRVGYIAPGDGIRSHRTNTFPPVSAGIIPTSNPNPTGITNPSNINSTCFYGWSTGNFHRDVSYLPDTDYYGNTTRPGWLPLTLLPNGHPDAGKMRPDNATTVENAGYHSANSAAKRARTNETAPGALDTVVYAIGLGDPGANQHDFLRRVANDPLAGAGVYNPLEPTGFYEYAPSAADLNAAFARIASEILRIAK